MATKKKEQNLQMLNLGQLIPSENNDFPITEIEDLAESIKFLGLLTPLTVTPTDGEEETYEILSGERRFTALKELIQDEAYATYETVPCYVLPREVMNEFKRKLAVIAANIDVRDNFNVEAYRFKVVSIVKEMLDAKEITKKESVALFAKYMKTSERYSRNYQAVFGTELQPMVENKEILVKAASPIATLKDEEKKVEVMEKVKEEVEKRRSDPSTPFKPVNKDDINALLAELEEDDDEEVDEDLVLDADIEKQMKGKAQKKGYLTEELVDASPRSEVTVVSDRVKKMLSNLTGKTVSMDDKNLLLEMQQLLNNFVKEIIIN